MEQPPHYVLERTSLARLSSKNAKWLLKYKWWFKWKGNLTIKLIMLPSNVSRNKFENKLLQLHIGCETGSIPYWDLWCIWGAVAECEPKFFWRQKNFRFKFSYCSPNTSQNLNRIIFSTLFSIRIWKLKFVSLLL